MDEQKNANANCEPPIYGQKPWTFQQYHSSSSIKNRTINDMNPDLTPEDLENLLNNPDGNVRRPTSSDFVNIRNSCTTFFHFLRMMQMFPDVHPASIHTVLTLAGNDFFRACDKLIWARKCKVEQQKANVAAAKAIRGRPIGVNKNAKPGVTKYVMLRRRNGNSSTIVQDGKDTESLLATFRLPPLRNSNSARDSDEHVLKQHGEVVKGDGKK